MANPSVTYTFTNGTTADGAQVSQNFADLISGMTDGTKTFSIDAITVGGAAIFNSTVTIGGKAISNPMDAVGDIIYGGVSGALTKLAGNTTTARKFLRGTGTGAAAQAPAWDTTPAKIAILCSSLNTGQADGLTRYIGSDISATADVISYRAPISGTIKNLYCWSYGQAAGTRTWTVMVEGAATGVTCSNSGAVIRASDTSNTASVTAGQVVCVRIVTSGGASNVTASATFMIEEA